jgi:hypothetical protein
MTLHVELKPQMEEELAAAAEANGMTIESYARQLLQEALASHPASRSRASREEFRRFLQELATDARSIPQLRAETFSRETIYGEHD